MIVDLAELSRVQPKLAGHLHMHVREMMSLARIDPGLSLRRNRFLRLPQGSQPSQ